MMSIGCYGKAYSTDLLERLLYHKRRRLCLLHGHGKMPLGHLIEVCTFSARFCALLTPPSASARLSNFQVDVPRESPGNRNSLALGVSDFIKKATRRNSSVGPDNDTSSIWSNQSSSSKIFRLPRSLAKKSSNSSIVSSASKAPADTVSISSKRGANSDKGYSEHGHHHRGSTSGPRSASGSIRRFQTPPSSFPTRAMSQESPLAARQSLSINIRDIFDDEKLKTAADIQKEIQAVEGEQRRLIDAFNGLELTTLSKVRRHHRGKASVHGSDSNAGSGLGESETRSHRRMNPSESDAVSIRSGVSFTPSVARSAYSSRNKTLRAKATHAHNSSLALPSPSASSLHRKDSSSSFSSDLRRLERSQGSVPPVPAMPHALMHGHLRANNSSISLARSTGNAPMDVVHEDEDRATMDTVRMEEEAEYDAELEDIRRRREEVNQRYEARLEFLRAKLKGAQLHEKLRRK